MNIGKGVGWGERRHTCPRYFCVDGVEGDWGGGSEGGGDEVGGAAACRGMLFGAGERSTYTM